MVRAGLPHRTWLGMIIPWEYLGNTPLGNGSAGGQPVGYEFLIFGVYERHFSSIDVD